MYCCSYIWSYIWKSCRRNSLGKRLIEKKNLLDTAIPEDDSLLIEDEKKHERHSRMYASAVFQLIIAIGIGTIFSWALTKTGLTFPIYIVP